MVMVTGNLTSLPGCQRRKRVEVGSRSEQTKKDSSTCSLTLENLDDSTKSLDERNRKALEI